MQGAILVVDDERSICIAIERLLRSRGYEVESAHSGEAAVAALERRRAHLVITDLSLTGMSGMDLLRRIKQETPDTAVLMITAYGSERLAVEAMKLGAADYLRKPFDNDELELMVDRTFEAMALRRDFRLLQDKVADAYRYENLVGKSPAMQRVFDLIGKVADTDLTVLIRGPSGTGKELVANAIHYNSHRRTKPFVKVNCAAVANELVESELFGHERGAFTGATAAREGKFEIAHGGTLLLDEVGDMSVTAQAKILRTLQTRELERVGGNRTIKVDVRILAATNHDLEAKVRAGSFREDLYYRLNVVAVTLPSLRERLEDLPLLIDHFLGRNVERLHSPRKTLTPAALRGLLAHEWKGNVRELEHALEQAIVLAPGNEIGLEDLPATVRAPLDSVEDDCGSFGERKQRVVERFERACIRDALERHRGNVSHAAEDLGMYRQQLQAKLSDYGIDPATYRDRRGE